MTRGKIFTDGEFQQAFDEAAEDLELELEKAPEWPPWGFVMVSVHGHGGHDDCDQEAVEAEIRAVIEAYEALGPELGDAELVRELERLTTDPFVCVEEETSYEVEHASLYDQLETWRERARDRGLDGPGGSVEIDFAGFWHLCASIVTVNFRSRRERIPGEVVSTAILRLGRGGWKINILSHHYSS